MVDPAELKVDSEKVLEWIKKGAKPTDTALALIKKAGVEIQGEIRMYKDLLEYIVKNLVTNPDDVEIREVEADNRLVLKLKVNKEDMGRIIGKEGRIIRSIREIIYAYAMKDNKKVSVDVEENNKGED